MKKKLFSLLLVFAMIAPFFSFGTSVKAASSIANGQLDCTSGAVFWNIDSSGALTYSGAGVLSAYTTLTDFKLSSFGLTENTITSIDTRGTNIVLSAVSDSLFSGYENCESMDLSGLYTANVTSFKSMFKNCKSLQTLDLSKFNTSSAVNMESMFEGCTRLKALDLSSFNTENVTSMAYMFKDCTSLTGVNLTTFSGNKVKNMTEMFKNCSKIPTINLSSLYTRELDAMTGMFDGCSSLTNLNVTNLLTSGVTDMSNVFNGCTAIETLDLNNWNTISATNMNNMFNGCANLKYLDISKFSFDKVKYNTFMWALVDNLQRIVTPEKEFQLPKVNSNEIWVDDDRVVHYSLEKMTKHTTVVRAKDTYNITYVTKGTLKDVSATYNVKTGLLNLGSSSLALHTFKSWCTDKERTFPITRIEPGTYGDITLYASFEHPWNNGVIIKQPTYTEDGMKMYTCTSCGEIKYEVIPKLITSSNGLPAQINETVVNRTVINETVINPSADATSANAVPTVGNCKIKSVVRTNKALTVKYSKVSGATGYQVSISTKKSFAKKYRTTYTISFKSLPSKFVNASISSKHQKKIKKCVGKKLKNGKKYYIRVRAFKYYKDDKGTNQKVNGKWSKISIKTPKKWTTKSTTYTYN